MGVWFLAFASIASMFTLNVFLPSRHRLLWLPSYLMGWLVGELPLHHLAWQVAIAVAFLLLGALHSASGWAALFVLCGSWLGLLASVARSQRARPLLQQALDQALGHELAGDGDDFLTRLRAPLSPTRLLLPFRFAHRDVERIADIPYATAGGHRNHLDLYRPRAATTNAPVLLQIHGGGWITGHKRQQALPLLHDLASRGFVCVSANYRLSPRATFPDHLIDVKRALVWVRKHVAEYGGDPTFVVVTGGSAGGHLAALLALTPNLPEYQPGDESVDTTVQGCIPCYGIYDLAGLSTDAPAEPIVELWEQTVLKRKFAEAKESFERASPYRYVHEAAPPFFILQGSHDTVVSVPDARAFAEALRKRSRSPVVYAELPGAQHAFDVFHSIRTHHMIEAIRRFLAHLLAQRAVKSR